MKTLFPSGGPAAMLTDIREAGSQAEPAPRRASGPGPGLLQSVTLFPQEYIR